MKRNILFLLALVVAGCESTEGEDAIMFDRPQILPNSNILCLSYLELVSGVRTTHSVLLTNRGREPLLIENARIENDLRGAFSIDRIRTADGVDCTENTPCELASTEDAFLRFFYEPTSPGWDATDIRVTSNAQNFPNLRIYVLARARPTDLASGTEFDAGPRPASAFGRDGEPTCPDN